MSFIHGIAATLGKLEGQMDAWGGGAGTDVRNWWGFEEFWSRKELRPSEEEEGRRMWMKAL